jgi:hypothetical protein
MGLVKRGTDVLIGFGQVLALYVAPKRCVRRWTR